MIVVSQEKYTERVLERFGMLDCNPSSTPFLSERVDASHCPTSEEEKAALSSMRAQYKRACGSLLYLSTWTRPDIAEAVRCVCTFVSNPGLPHWRAVKKIFSYLKGHQTLSLVFSSSSSSNTLTPAVAFTDSDYANDKETRHSVSGGVVFLSSAPVIWVCRSQGSVTLSSTEAETVALTELLREVVWLRNLLREMGYEQKEPTVVYIDNQAAKSIANNEQSSRRLKHFDVDYRWNREQIARGLATLRHVPSKQNLADFLTKPLAGPRFAQLRAAFVI
jgi:hypothetical protein